ncbi:MAG: exopolysaccharide biosynthesis protein [Bdellovibrionia bacterium]
MNNNSVIESPVLKGLDKLAEQFKIEGASLEELFDYFGVEGHYLLITFMILPFLQPIPLWGLSTPFGILISVVAFFAHINKKPLLPQKWKTQKINGNTILKIRDAGHIVFEKILFMIYPRMEFLFNGPFKYFNTGIIIFNGILLALPLPVPFSNAFPGWVILFQSLAHLEKDGLFIIISYVQALLCILFFGALLLGFESGLQYFMTSISSLLT